MAYFYKKILRSTQPPRKVRITVEEYRPKTTFIKLLIAFTLSPNIEFNRNPWNKSRQTQPPYYVFVSWTYTSNAIS